MVKTYQCDSRVSVSQEEPPEQEQDEQALYFKYIVKRRKMISGFSKASFRRNNRKEREFERELLQGHPELGRQEVSAVPDTELGEGGNIEPKKKGCKGRSNCFHYLHHTTQPSRRAKKRVMLNRHGKNRGVKLVCGTFFGSKT